RRRIYGRINLYGPYPPNDSRFDYLCALLSETTHLAPYIRSVVVRLDLARLQPMTRLLRACTRLESLAICFTAQITCLDLPHLPLELMDALLFRMASDSLHRLEIWGQVGLLMPDCLLHFALGSVRTLALRRITITQAPESQARLQKLTLVQWSDRFVPLLEAAAPTLQEFRVDLAAALWQGDTVFPPPFPVLRVGELRLPVGDPEWDNIAAPPTVHRLLRAAPLLERLRLFYTRAHRRASHPARAGSESDLVRADGRALPHLRTVHCFLSFPPSFEGDQNGCVQLLSRLDRGADARVAQRGAGVLSYGRITPEGWASWDTWPA
ncbi:hypothetical protein B0H14DRAFT_2861403, partial [Mycena olivaceomarginata]